MKSRPPLFQSRLEAGAGGEVGGGEVLYFKQASPIFSDLIMTRERLQHRSPSWRRCLQFRLFIVAEFKFN